MSTLTIASDILNIQQPELREQFSRSWGLVAQWSTVDGKLVCKWFPESQEKFATQKPDGSPDSVRVG